MAEQEKEASMKIIRKPTKKDYETVPDEYKVTLPLLSWTRLNEIPAGIKRMHDWYMRASYAGIDSIYAIIPEDAFLGGQSSCMFNFEDLWLMMNLKRLDVQIVTLFAL